MDVGGTLTSSNIGITLLRSNLKWWMDYVADYPC